MFVNGSVCWDFLRHSISLEYFRVVIGVLRCGQKYEGTACQRMRRLAYFKTSGINFWENCDMLLKK